MTQPGASGGTGGVSGGSAGGDGGSKGGDGGGSDGGSGDGGRTGGVGSDGAGALGGGGSDGSDAGGGPLHTRYSPLLHCHKSPLGNVTSSTQPMWPLKKILSFELKHPSGEFGRADPPVVTVLSTTIPSAPPARAHSAAVVIRSDPDGQSAATAPATR